MRHTITGKQPNSKMCLVCGMKNPLGLKAFFYETDAKELIAIFKTIEEHQSYPNRLHGGIAAAILDETIGRAILMHHEEEVWGVTVEFKTRFKKAIPLNDELRVIGRITKEGSRFFEGTGELLLSNGDIAVTAEGKYLKLPLDQIADFDREENEWRVISSDNDPSSIEI
ncbi:MAG: PaaI family thioesterase [candidate division WOR-3 bacterium]|nr:MAG: PaaI family thioesterase [candidate division WOR-3 bacterium]